MINFNPKNKNSKNKPQIILICGAKGGVGKSTICYNLALASQKLGQNTAIIDADIYGPSIHHLCGVKQQAPEIKHNLMLPRKVKNLQLNSMGFLIPKENALIWRGPMISKAINNLINNTVWTDLAQMFIDMPPGTGDAYLSLLKNFPTAKAVIITQPQKISLIDTNRTIDLMQKVNIEIIGLIENMTNHLYKDKVKYFCKEHKIKKIGSIEFDQNIPLLAENNQNIIEDHHNHAKVFYQIAKKIVKL